MGGGGGGGVQVICFSITQLPRNLAPAINVDVDMVTLIDEALVEVWESETPKNWPLTSKT